MTKLIEPAVATAVARRLSGEVPASLGPAVDRLRSNLQSAVPRAEELVATASGIAAPAPVRWGVIDRGAWAEANIDGMSTLISPLADRIGQRLDSAPFLFRMAQRGLVSVEVGAILGYISRRVLGQYDLLVAEEARAGRRRRAVGDAALYFVGPNMAATERRLGFVPEDFALWVAVHEVTHRFQFAGVPWLREHFFALINSYMGSLQIDVKGLARRLGDAARKLASKSTPVEERNAVYLLSGEEQRASLDQIQALMAVVEGHGNYVMDKVGEEVIPSFRRMRGAFQRRNEQTKLVQRIVNQAIGLEMKLKQYEMGQRFCDRAVAVGGTGALAHLWADPANLPTLEELKAPERWVKRVA